MSQHILSPLVVLAGALALPATRLAPTATTATTAPQPILEPASAQADDANPLAIFPVPSADLEISIGGDATPSLADVLMQFEDICGHNLHISTGTLQELRDVTTGLSRSVTVPRQEVYSYVSALLSSSGFVMAETRAVGPRLLSIWSLNSHERGLVRAQARAVDVDEIARYERHPALLVETVLYVENIDARQVTNSMRVTVTDANIQVITPISAHSLLLTGTGPEVADWIRLIRSADAGELQFVEPEVPVTEPGPGSK